MTPEISLGLTQVIIGVISIFIAPIVSKTILEVFTRPRSVAIECRPTTGNSRRSRCWMARLHFAKHVGDRDQIQCITANVRNKILRANQVKTVDGPDRIVTQNHCKFVIDTKSIPDDSVISIYVELNFPDTIQFYCSGKSIPRYIDPKFDPFEVRYTSAKTNRYMLIIAQYRLLWVALTFSIYALLSVARILYLGFNEQSP